MADAGVRGRPIAPLVLSPQERAYLGLLLSTGAVHPCAQNFEVAVEGDEISAISWRNQPKLFVKAEKCRRRARCHDKGISKGGRVGSPHSAQPWAPASVPSEFVRRFSCN
jgi:hypothetical protein